MAFQSKPERDRICSQTNFIRYTPNTITDLETLYKELALVKIRGYAVDDEEHDIGVRCIGTPIWGRDGEAVASVSISGPAVRITRERVPNLAEMTVMTALDISKALGFQGKPSFDGEKSAAIMS